MWKNLLVASFRSLLRNKRFAGLNILGLAVGLDADLQVGPPPGAGGVAVHDRHHAHGRDRGRRQGGR
ncbi:MAG: hypothetical protein R6X21_02680 [Candidatus Aminicenantes bacterium]